MHEGVVGADHDKALNLSKSQLGLISIAGTLGMGIALSEITDNFLISFGLTTAFTSIQAALMAIAWPKLR